MPLETRMETRLQQIEDQLSQVSTLNDKMNRKVDMVNKFQLAQYSLAQEASSLKTQKGAKWKVDDEHNKHNNSTGKNTPLITCQRLISLDYLMAQTTKLVN